MAQLLTVAVVGCLLAMTARAAEDAKPAAKPDGVPGAVRVMSFNIRNSIEPRK